MGTEYSGDGDDEVRGYQVLSPALLLRPAVARLESYGIGNGKERVDISTWQRLVSCSTRKTNKRVSLLSPPEGE